MKRIVCLVWGISIGIFAMGQPNCLGISTLKTTTLVFPFPVLHVDRGTKDVLVQPVKEAENILLIKAATKDFQETNLSVVTGDGNIYSFVIRYDGQPETWVFHLPPQSSASIERYANSILVGSQFSKGPRAKKWNIHARLAGIYIKNDVVFYKL